MTPDEVRAALDGHLSTAVSTIPVAWPGIPFIPPESAAWIRPAFRPGQAFEGEIGRVGLSRRTGVYIVQVFAPEGLGPGPALVLAGMIEAAFRRQDVDGVECGEPYAGDVVEDAANGPWLQCNVTVPWWAWIGE